MAGGKHLFRIWGEITRAIPFVLVAGCVATGLLPGCAHGVPGAREAMRSTLARPEVLVLYGESEFLLLTPTEKLSMGTGEKAGRKLLEKYDVRLDEPLERVAGVFVASLGENPQFADVTFTVGSRPALAEQASALGAVPFLYLDAPSQWGWVLEYGLGLKRYSMSFHVTLSVFAADREYPMWVESCVARDKKNKWTPEEWVADDGARLKAVAAPLADQCGRQLASKFATWVYGNGKSGPSSSLIDQAIKGEPATIALFHRVLSPETRPGG